MVCDFENANPLNNWKCKPESSIGAKKAFDLNKLNVHILKKCWSEPYDGTSWNLCDVRD